MCCDTGSYGTVEENCAKIAKKVNRTGKTLLYLRTPPSMNFVTDIEHCLDVLQNGGLILYPTDTIWGIGCDATNAPAVEKIYRLKNRSHKKSMTVLLSNEKDIPTYVTQRDLRVFDYIKGVTKPTTVIYEGATGLAPNLIGKDGTIAIRLVDDDFCRNLLHRFRKPLVSTPANLSHYPSPTCFTDVDDAIKNGVDYVVQHRQQDSTPALPSSVIKWNKDGSLSILRS
jgi:L-threonylcarbamoyladenylate synthase